jgi:hypothetical protein
MSPRRALGLVVPGALGLQLLAIGPAAAGPAEDKGLDIATKVDKAWGGYKSEENDLELELVSATGEKVVRKISGKMREAGADSEQTILTITWPADQKGTRLLTWSHRRKDDDQWLFLPSIQRVKRISARGRSGSFLGSEFAYEDLVNTSWVENYKFTYQRDQTVGSRQTWVVERVPRDKDSGYSKQVVWFDQEYLSALRVDSYDRKGKLLKTASFKSFEKYNGKWRSDRIDVVNRQTGKKSSVTWKKRSLGKTFSDDEFSPAGLED